jgi:CHAT domain-containing protein
MLMVIQPKAIGDSRALDSTRDELLKVKQIVGSDHLIPLDLSQEPVSTDKILSHLATASIAHFACHGQQDTQNPLESALILDHGQNLKVSRIMEQPMPGASLAFLSACETALGDEKLPDEAIHLAASMLFAGFRGAVATMW